MDNEMTVVDNSVEASPVVPSSIDTINAQKTAFTAQLEQVKTEMTKVQQQFEVLKVRGIKLEGALESLDILLKSLPK